MTHTDRFRQRNINDWPSHCACFNVIDAYKSYKMFVFPFLWKQFQYFHRMKWTSEMESLLRTLYSQETNNWFMITWLATFSNNWLGRGLATSSCKGLENKSFQLCRPYGLCQSYTTLPLWCESSHRHCVNKWVELCANKTLFWASDIWILYNFHVSQNILLLWVFFSTLERSQNILRLLAV